MPSQPVIEALEKLHKELDQLEPAIRHIQAAQNVTEEVKAIPKLHVKLLNDIKEIDNSHKEQLLLVFNKGIKEINSEHKILIKNNEALIQVIKSKTEEISSFTSEIKIFHEKVEKIDFPERLQSIENTVKNTILEIKKTREATVLELGGLVKQVIEVDFLGNFENLKKTINTSAQSNAEIANTIQNEKIPEKISEIQEKIEKKLDKGIEELNESSKKTASETIKIVNDLNFPLRLDKLDSSVASIQSSLINVISKTDYLERDVREQFNKLKEQLDTQNNSSRFRQNIIITFLVILLLSLIGALVIRWSRH